MISHVDAHHHFWQPARGDYGWLRPDVAALRALYRDFMPADLAPQLQAHGVVQTVLVQAAATEAETAFMLSLATSNNFIGGVVGWVDLADAGAASTLARWAEQHPKLKGVRPMLQDIADIDWIARAPHPSAVAALQRLGLRFDALVKPQHLGALLQFVKAWPQLPVVIDHAAKPQLADGWKAPWAEGWRRQIAELAAHPQVCCKFSGLLTEAPPSSGADTLRPVWEHLLQCFGPQRLMWGSDWPVVNLARDYAGWVDISNQLIGELSGDEQASVCRLCATRFYALEHPPE